MRRVRPLPHRYGRTRLYRGHIATRGFTVHHLHSLLLEALGDR